MTHTFPNNLYKHNETGAAMKTKKTDQRSKYTQSIIKKSLMKLAVNKPLNKITVSALCADAGTNRITFYNHFYDIYDVYETIENDFFNEIMSRLDNLKTYDAQVPIIREIVLHLYRNVDICMLLLNSKSDVIERLMKAAHEKFVSEITARHKGIPIGILKALFTFQINGYVGLIIDWVKNGMKETPEEMSTLIGEFSQLTLNSLIKHYDK